MITDALTIIWPFLAGLALGGVIVFAAIYLIVFHGGIELRTPEEQRISDLRDLAMSADHARTIRKLSPLPKDWELNHEILRANDRIRRQRGRAAR